MELGVKQQPMRKLKQNNMAMWRPATVLLTQVQSARSSLPSGHPVARCAACICSLADMTDMLAHNVSMPGSLQLSKKQLMERAKEEKRKSATGDKGKSSAKVSAHTSVAAAQSGR